MKKQVYVVLFAVELTLESYHRGTRWMAVTFSFNRFGTVHNKLFLEDLICLSGLASLLLCFVSTFSQEFEILFQNFDPFLQQLVVLTRRIITII